MDKSPQIKLSVLKLPASNLTKNLAAIFFAGLILLLILEAFELNNSVRLILGSGQEPPLVTQEKGVRINFDNYNEVVKRIEQAPDFQPMGGITKDPFQ